MSIDTLGKLSKLNYSRIELYLSMTVPSIHLLVPLLVVSLLGVGLSGFGYRLVSHFLRSAGWIGGAGLGGVIGWQILPQLIPELAASQQVTWTLALVIGGAVLGRLFFPVATRLAAVVAGFLSTAGAVGVFFVGESIINRIAGIDPTTEPVSTAEQLVFNLEGLFVAQGVELLGVMLAAGVIGAIVATRYHTELIAAGLTLGGALLLGIAIPLWQTALAGSAALGAGVSSASVTWTAVALVAGITIQLVDHRRTNTNSPESIY